MLVWLVENDLCCHMIPCHQLGMYLSGPVLLTLPPLHPVYLTHDIIMSYIFCLETFSVFWQHASLVNQTYFSVCALSSLRMRREERKEKDVWPNTPGFRFRLECDDVITLLRNSRYSTIHSTYSTICQHNQDHLTQIFP